MKKPKGVIIKKIGLTVVLMMLFKTFSFTNVIIIPDDCTMIQTGINMASTGDTVKVKYGTYYETLTINKDITLMKYSTQMPIVSYIQGATITIESAQAAVSGFDIQTSHQYGTGILIYGNKSVKIENCILSGLFTGICALQKQVEVYNCLIHDNDMGIYISKDTEANVFPALVKECCISNCTIYGNYKGVRFISNTNKEILNTILWGNSYADIVGSPTVRYSCIEDGYKGIGCISEPPLFADPVNGDYSLIWNTTNFSPCIDTGDPNSTWDADDTPPDMGAIPAISHKHEDWLLPPNSVDNGWKWMSFPSLNDLTNNPGVYVGDMAEYMLADILDYVILEKVVWKPLDPQSASLEYILYDGQSWSNLNHIFTSPQGYKFKMSDDLQDYVDLEISGFLENKNTEIHLWGNLEENWIGYFLEETQIIEDAFGSAMDNISSIQMQHWGNKREEQDPDAPWIIPEYKVEQTVSYGDMLIVQCFEEMDFQWNDNGSVPPHEEKETSYFTFSEQADYVPIFIEFDPENLPDEIGVSVDGECKGASVVEDTLSQICAYIHGCNGELEFELYYDNKGTGSNFNIKEYFVYNPETKLKDKRTIKVDENKDYYLVSFKANESETIMLPKIRTEA